MAKDLGLRASAESDVRRPGRAGGPIGSLSRERRATARGRNRLHRLLKATPLELGLQLQAVDIGHPEIDHDAPRLTDAWIVQKLARARESCDAQPSLTSSRHNPDRTDGSSSTTNT